MIELMQQLHTEEKARTQSGVSTSDVILTSHRNNNSVVFTEIYKLYLSSCSRIADVTYGQGVFWSEIDTSAFNFLPTDLKTGVDFRSLDYPEDHLDAVVFDPPYMEGFYRRQETHLAGGGSHDAFRKYYSNGEATTAKGLKYHDRVLEVYAAAGKILTPMLKDGGFFVVKCQDEVSANRQKLSHVEILYMFDKLGYYAKDLFVVTRMNKPSVSRLLKQEHARKNHSYFLILQKKGKNRYSNFRPLLDELVDD